MSDRIDLVALLQPGFHLHRVHGGLADRDGRAGAGDAVGVHLEQADDALLLAVGRPPDEQDVVEPLELDRAVHAQVGPGAFRQLAGERHVDRHRAVLHGRVDPRHAAGDDAIARVDRRRLSDHDVLGLRLGDLQLGLQMALVGDAGQLRARAGMIRHLQDASWKPGAGPGTGTPLARVADQGHLKAQLKVPETQAKDVMIGQTASIDTRNGIIPGRVSRIDPAVQNGTVTVDVALTGELPKGARPDLSVDGTIELERLDDILFVGRPTYGQEQSVIRLFKVDADGVTCTRTTVSIGKTSVNTVEVKSGLKQGDQVVLSDMSQYDAFDRIRLK